MIDAAVGLLRSLRSYLPAAVAMRVSPADAVAVRVFARCCCPCCGLRLLLSRCSRCAWAGAMVPRSKSRTPALKASFIGIRLSPFEGIHRKLKPAARSRNCAILGILARARCFILDLVAHLLLNDGRGAEYSNIGLSCQRRLQPHRADGAIGKNKPHIF